MDQPGDTIEGDSFHKSVMLKTNDIPIDLREATIHKYTIKVTPDDLTTKEKNFLAEKFVARLKLSHKSFTTVHNNKFEFFVPHAVRELEETFFQVVCVRQKDTFNSAVLTYLRGKQFYTKFLTDEIIIREPGQSQFRPDSGSEHHSLQLCTVAIEKEEVNVDSIEGTPKHEQPAGILRLQQRILLDALDSILWQGARDTSSVHVYGNKAFDMDEEPAMEGPVIELRAGLNAETCIGNGSVVRRITPCTGFFLKSMKLSELMRLLRSAEVSTGPSLDMKQLNLFLKGVKVRKVYGKKDVVQIVGLANGNADQETFYWNNHKTTTVSHYIEKVYHPENLREHPQQKCVVVGSSERHEVLPPNLCSVVPGQYFSLPASSDYFEKGSERDFHNLLRDVASSCVSPTEGPTTKLLRSSLSPTVAAKFGLKVSGIGEQFAFRAQNSQDCNPMVEGQIFARKITASKKKPDLGRQLLVLVFASSNLGSLKNLFTKGFNKHAQSVAQYIGSRVSSHPIQYHLHSEIGKLVADAQKELPKEPSQGLAGAHRPKPAIVGIFQKPQGLGKPGTSAQQEIELNKLRLTYEAMKLYCHQEGYHFAGTFVGQSFRSQDDRKMKPLVSNTLRRLTTQVETAEAPGALTTVAPSPCRTILLGIHVAALQTNCPEKPLSGKTHAAGWYLVSIVAKWSRSGAFHKARTFLQKSCKSEEGSPHTFPGALAMASSGEEIVQQLVNGASLAGSSIIVLRAGVAAGKYTHEEAAKVSAYARRKVEEEAAAKQMKIAAEIAAQGSRPITPSPAKTATWALAAEQNLLVENPVSPRYRNMGDDEISDSNRNTTENDSSNGQSAKFSTTQGTSPERDSREPIAKLDPTMNPEVQTLRSFADAQNARLAYVEVDSRTKARLFDQDGESLRVKETGGMTSADPKLLFNIVAPASMPVLHSPTAELLVQKQLPTKAGRNTPVQLKLRSVDKEFLVDRTLLNAVSEASWDFPAGTWSSKNLSCVTLAKKANRHAMRVVQIKNGEPSLPEIHPDLKESLYFV